MRSDLMIEINNVSKDYLIYQKSSGFKNAVKDMFKRNSSIKTAVDALNLNIDKGTIVGMIGENGAGKTTTLKMLSGILHPTSGSIHVNGYTPFERKRDFLKEISFVMGNKNQLIWDLPAIDSFGYQKKIYEIPDAQYKKTLNEMVDLFDSKALIDVPIRKLSLGQRMKMELINSVLHQPKLIFLDEPTIGLDLVTQKRIRQFIKDYNQLTQATIILTSHYMTDIEETADRVTILHSGKKIYDNQLSELYKEYKGKALVTICYEGVLDEKAVKQHYTVIDSQPDKLKVYASSEDKKSLLDFLFRSGVGITDFFVEDTPFELIVDMITNKGA